MAFVHVSGAFQNSLCLSSSMLLLCCVVLCCVVAVVIAIVVIAMQESIGTPARK